jgi:hypothetical protein
MRKIVLVAFATLSCSVLSAQFRLKNVAETDFFSPEFSAWLAEDQSLVSKKDDADDLPMVSQQVISNFICAMESGSAVDLKANCTPDMVYRTEMTDQNGKTTVFEETVGAIAEFTLQSGNNFGINIEYGVVRTTKGNLLKQNISVSTDYAFLLNGQQSHCGMLTFDLTKTTDGWKIKSLVDTHHRQCE